MNLKEAVEKFENGEEVRTIEMGGISERYEMGIQMLAFALAKEGKIYKSGYDVKIPELLKEYGYSGAQVMAAAWLSNQFISEDYEGLFERAIKDNKADRIIKIKKKTISACDTKFYDEVNK